VRAIIENLKNESGDFTVLDVIIRLTLGLEDAENGCCFECGRDKFDSGNCGAKDCPATFRGEKK
tara:strand:+ start:4246 stop:4437 length:192 start_codon:yes stop_codon:yes gene_type:complete